MKPVVFSQLARREIDAAAEWHESRQEGLGQKFYDRVAEAAEAIQNAPEGFQLVYKDLRRIQLKQFTDWGLWYRVLVDNSVVVACLSSRGSPQSIRERVAGIIQLPTPGQNK